MRTVEILESERRSGSAFDGPMVLLHDVLQILDLTNVDVLVEIPISPVSRIGKSARSGSDYENYRPVGRAAGRI